MNGGTPARAHSSIQIALWSGVRPRPPCSIGQWMPAQPFGEEQLLPGDAGVDELVGDDRPVVARSAVLVRGEPRARVRSEVVEIDHPRHPAGWDRSMRFLSSRTATDSVVRSKVPPARMPASTDWKRSTGARCCARSSHRPARRRSRRRVAQAQHFGRQLSLLGQQVVAERGASEGLPLVVAHEVEDALPNPVDAEPVREREVHGRCVGD